ncbi:PREDICTED: solute carrier family 35 member D3-like [Priapulus caudatus]|uniref:Solute carrier family 35 member D3-like n=1 Tax=Priapulus caudatus TaxID=37621 RepID=A0ABM1EZJ7_PRICU|nr:PREDICTED: solute carrier family 35 member D3-like [Priapulus caudatus]
MTAEGIGAAVFYGVCSSSMAFLNKAVLNTYGFNYPFFIMTLQMLFSVVVLEALRLTNKVNIPAYSLARGRYFLLPSICYAFHATLSLVALSGMNIPMYGLLKRCTPLVNLALSVFMLKKGAPPATVVVAVMLITGGCVVAGLGDLTFDPGAYAACAASVFAQAFYLTLVQRCGEAALSAHDILQLNSFNCLPMVAAATLLRGEPAAMMRGGDGSAPWRSAEFAAALAATVCAGALLNYALFRCTTLNSALTTSLVAAAKGVAQTCVGAFAFGGVALNAPVVAGIAANTAGGALYVYGRYRQGAPASRASDAERGTRKRGNDVNANVARSSR